jgi:arsenite methyltransferase
MDLRSREGVTAYDDAPLWSAAFGLMLLEHLPYAPALRTVLDLGCGTGFPSLELAERIGPACQVHGVDRWAMGLERARFKAGVRGVRNVTFHEADAESLPFADHAFDLIVSNLGVNNFERREAVLSECHRVLRPGGSLALTTNLVGHMAAFYEHFRATLHDASDARALDALDKEEGKRATVAGTRDLLAVAGFTVTRVESRTLPMSFADGTAFIRLAFLEAWQGVVASGSQPSIFAALERRLNQAAAEAGGLHLSVPMLFVLAQR